MAERAPDFLAWQRRTMPVTHRVLAALASRRVTRRRLAYWGHLTENSVLLLQWLAGTGVDLRVGVCDPNTASPAARERLRHLSFFSNLTDAVAWRPELVLDTGAELIARMTSAGEPPLAAVESTTSGTNVLSALDVTFPVMQWADVALKRDVEHRHHVAAGVLGAIAWLTGMSVEGRRVLVVGYGRVGEGIAHRARALGALVTVAEPQPLRAVNARLAGHDVVDAPAAAAHHAEFVITATGRKGALDRNVLTRLPDGAIVANGGHSRDEIDFELLDRGKAAEVRAGIREYRLGTKSLYVLTEGSPVNLAVGRTYGDDLWDLFSAATVLSCDWLITGGWYAAPAGVQPLSEEAQSHIARLAAAPAAGRPGFARVEPVIGRAGHLLQELLGPQLGTNQSHSVAHSTLSAGAVIDEHHHRRSEETYIVLSGSMSLWLGGVAHEVGALDLVAIPPGVAHAVTAGPQGAELLAVSVPPWHPGDHLPGAGRDDRPEQGWEP